MSVTSTQTERPRRLPLLTTALCLALGGGFVSMRDASLDAQELRHAALEEASAYIIEHPYLDPGPELEDYVGAERIENLYKALMVRRDRRGAPPIDAGTKRRGQAGLDEIMQRAGAPLESLPGRVYGLRPAHPGLEQILTHAAVHVSGLHVSIGMLLLFWLGSMLERFWGSGLLLVFEVGAVATTGAAYVTMNPGSQVALVGSSGLAMSLLTAYALNAAGAKRDGVYWLTLLSGAGLLVAPAILGLEWSQVAPAGDVVEPGAAGWALSGGVVYGVVAAVCIWLLPSGTASEMSHLSKSERAVQATLARAIKSVESGRLEKAFVLLREAIRAAPNDRSVALQIWTVARRLGKQREAASIVLSVIRDEIRTDEIDAAIGHWLELTQSGCEFRAEPALLIRLAPLLAQEGNDDAAVQALRRALDGVRDGAVPGVAFRVARAARELDPETSREAAWLALGSVELEIGERQELEEILGELEESFPSDSISADTPLVSAPVALPSGSSPAVVANVPRSSVRPEPLDIDFGETDGNAGPSELATDLVWELPADAPEAESPRSAGFRTDAIEVEDLTDALAPEIESVRHSTGRSVEAIEAIPVELRPRQLRVELPGHGKRTVNLSRVDAVGCAVVDGLGEGPVVVIDLALNHRAGSADALKVVRMRADQFDARDLGVGRDDASEVDALRAVLSHLIDASNATPLPDPMSARGLPFTRYDSIEQYTHEVFGARC